MAAPIGRPGRGAADGAPGRRDGPGPRRQDRRPPAPDTRSVRDRAGGPVREPRANPRVDVRPGPGRPRAPPTRGRADPGGARARSGGRRASLTRWAARGPKRLARWAAREPE